MKFVMRGGVYAVALCVTLSSVSLVASEESENDPLLPVWRRLDHLSDDIAKSFLNFYHQVADDTTDATIETFVSHVKTSTSQGEQNILRSLRNEASSLRKMETSMTESLQQVYAENLKPHLDSDVATVELRVNKFIATMEKATPLPMATIHTTTPVNKTEAAPAPSVEASSLNDLTNTITAMLDDITDKLSLLNAGLNTTLKSTQAMNTTERRVQVDASATCGELLNQTTPVIEEADRIHEIMEYYSSPGGEEEDPVQLPRDCSDYHWHHPEASSGVYTIYPTRNYWVPIQAWCDMDESGDGSDGGWTVILRRRNTSYGLVNFNRSWEEYAKGFGNAGQGEWWFGLTWLHALTYTQPYQVRFLIRDMTEGTFKAEYANFRVEDEARKFRLIVDGFSGNVSVDAFKTKHAGLPFSTPDQDNDNCVTCNCAFNNQGGWWYNVCHWTTLTAPFPSERDENQRVMKWLSGKWLVLDDVTMKVRPASYAKAFASSEG